MKKSILLLSVLAMGASLYAQQDQGRVGINTPDPKATLDISKDGVDDAKGVLIPRLTADEVKTMTDSGKVGDEQNSLLLYVTQPFASPANKTGKYGQIDQAGYYYYDAKDNGGKWKKLSVSENLWENIPSRNIAKLKNLSDGKTERTEDKNVFVTDKGHVGIGTSSPSERLDVDGNIKSSALQGNGRLYLYADDDGVIRKSTIPLDAFKTTITAGRLECKNDSKDQLWLTNVGILICEEIMGSDRTMKYMWKATTETDDPNLPDEVTYVSDIVEIPYRDIYSSWDGNDYAFVINWAMRIR